MLRTLPIILTIALASPAVWAEADAKPADAKHVEYGRVDWLRNYDQAVAQAKESGKPILILFDEVPGCGNCKRYGMGPLSNPLIVDAAQQCFVPLAIRNNSKGDHDAKILKQFKMRSWDNPQVRIVDVEGKDVVPYKRNDWTDEGLILRMVAALEKTKKAVPGYLKLVAEEIESASRRQKACFAMGCYWSGDRVFGAVDGVYATTIGWLGGHEVLEMEFDPKKVTFEDLLALSKKSFRGGFIVYARTDEQHEAAKKAGAKVQRSDKPVDTSRTVQKNSLSYRGRLALVPMTEAQAVKVNAALARRKDVTDYLSPTQIKLSTAIHESKVFPKDTRGRIKVESDLGLEVKELAKAWRDLEAKLAEAPLAKDAGGSEDADPADEGTCKPGQPPVVGPGQVIRPGQVVRLKPNQGGTITVTVTGGGANVTITGVQASTTTQPANNENANDDSDAESAE